VTYDISVHAYVRWTGVTQKTDQYASEKRLSFSVRMQQKSLGGRAPPEPAGGAYSAPRDPLAGFMGERRGGKEERKRKRGKGGN